MTFDRPGAWALLALAVPIVLLFLRYRRRVDVEVPSLDVWLDVAPAGSGRRGLRRAEDTLQLAALLAALAAFTAALAGPVLGAAPGPVRRLVVVLDVSASMSARAGGVSRFDEARAAADLAIERLGPGDEVIVWAASAQPQVAVEPTTDRAAARAALAQLRPTLERSGVRNTLDVARLAAGRDGLATVLVLTDSVGAADLGDAAALGPLAIGAAGRHDARNVGIVDASVDTADEERLRVRIARTDGPAGRRSVVLFHDGAEKHRVDVDVPEHGAADVVLPLGAFAPAGGVAEVRLLPADDFEPDDVAAFVVPSPRRVRVALVAPGMQPSPFLREALRAMGERLDAAEGVVTHPDAAGATFASSDVLVVEDVMPAAAPPSRATLLFGAPGRAVERPIVWSVGAHPVLAGVDLAPLRIDRAHVLDVAPGERVLIECAEGPVAVASDVAGDARRVRIGFRPDATTLPLEAAFPLLVRNAVEWLARRPLLPWAVRGGAAIVTPDRLPDVERVWFVGPGGLAPRPAALRDGAIVEPVPLPQPAGPRVMTVRGLPGDPRTAVNWFAPAGFRLVPAPDGAAAPATSRVASPADAVRGLPDRTGNADTRVRPAGWLALLGAASLLAASLGTSRRSGDPGIRRSGDSRGRERLQPVPEGTAMHERSPA